MPQHHSQDGKAAELFVHPHTASPSGPRAPLTDVNGLGHVGRRKDERMPKQLLWKKRACHGTKNGWRDQMAGDLQVIGLKDGGISCVRIRRQGLSAVVMVSRKWPRVGNNTCSANSQLNNSHFYFECGRTFGQQGDLIRHKRFCKNSR